MQICARRYTYTHTHTGEPSFRTSVSKPAQDGTQPRAQGKRECVLNSTRRTCHSQLSPSGPDSFALACPPLLLPSRTAQRHTAYHQAWKKFCKHRSMCSMNACTHGTNLILASARSAPRRPIENRHVFYGKFFFVTRVAKLLTSSCRGSVNVLPASRWRQCAVFRRGRGGGCEVMLSIVQMLRKS